VTLATSPPFSPAQAAEKEETKNPQARRLQASCFLTAIPQGLDENPGKSELFARAKRWGDAVNTRNRLETSEKPIESRGDEHVPYGMVLLSVFSA